MSERGFPCVVRIDDTDRCDGCGFGGRRGVAWGAGRPVLCVDCVADARELLWREVEPLAARQLRTKGPKS